MLRGAKQGELSLQELNMLKWLLGQVLALIGLWSLLELNFIHSPLVLFACGAVAVTVLFPGLVGEVSSWFWRILVVALIALVVLDFLMAREHLLPPLMRMVAGLTFLRCLQYRRRREDLQLVLLSLFVSVVSGVLTLSLAFGLQILLFTPVAMALLFITNLLEPVEIRALEKEDWRGFNWIHFARRLYRGFDFRLAGFSILLFGSAVALSTLVFISLPRFNMSHRFAFLQPQGVGKIGFNESVTFGEIGRILRGPDSAKAAFRVEYPEGTLLPPSLYWRMLVLDVYQSNSFRLSSSARRLGQEMRTESILEMEGTADGSTEGNWQFFLEGNVSRFLPLVGQFDRMRLERRTRMYINQALHLFQLEQTPGSVFAYQVEGMAIKDRFAASLDEQLELEAIEVDYQTPYDPYLEFEGTDYPASTLTIPGNPRDVEVLEDIVAEILLTRLGGSTLDRALLKGDEERLNRPTELFSHLEIARAVADWLNDHYVYSLSEDSRTRDSIYRDSLCVWLETGSSGWCEHFAGAMVLILRTAGVPARMVVGFSGMSVNDYQGYMVVRNSNAHAWVEVYDGEGWWVRFDPSPQQGEVQEEDGWLDDAGQLREVGMGAWLDSLRMLWYRRVVNFSQEDQDQMTSSLRSASTQLYEQWRLTLQTYWLRLVEWLYAPWDAQRVIRLIGVVAVVGAVCLVLRSSRSLLSSGYYLLLRKLGRGRRMDPARRKAGRLLVQVQAIESQVPAMHRAEYRQVKTNLQLICYGRQQDRPAPVEVFRRAHRLLKLYG